MNAQILVYSWGNVCNVWQTYYRLLLPHLGYGPDLERVTSVTDRTYNQLYEKYYWDDYEEKTADGVTTRYWYIYGPDGLIGIYTEKDTQSGVEERSCVALTDQLGSIVGLCDNYDIFYMAAYDEWGNRYMEEPIFTSVFYDLDRGYCGHEHIKELGLINMNSA